MGFFKDAFNRNKLTWFTILDQHSGSLSDEMKYVIRYFLIDDDILYDKYATNERAYNLVCEKEDNFELSIMADEEKNHFVASSSFKKYWIKPSYEIGMGIRPWFIIGYPDVAQWILNEMENESAIGKHILKNEDKYFDENGIKFPFFRYAIDQYKNKVGKPECQK
jgi:hypothetical protein